MEETKILKKEIKYYKSLIEIQCAQIRRLQNDYMDSHSKYLKMEANCAKLEVQLEKVKLDKNE